MTKQDERTRALGTGKRLNFDSPPPQRSRKKVKRATAEFNQAVFIRLWGLLKQQGWQAKAAGGLGSWIYLAPGVTRVGEGIDNETLFKTDQALFRFICENSNKLFQQATVAGDDKPEYNWRQTWRQLQRQGWKLDYTACGINYVAPHEQARFTTKGQVLEYVAAPK